MPSKLYVRALALVLAAGLAAACGPSADEQAAGEQAAAREAKWEEIQEQKQALDAKRAELEQLREQAAAEPAATPAGAAGAGGAQGEAAADPEARAAQLENEIQSMADELQGDLVAYINQDPPVEGEPYTPEQLQAFRMKSDLDMLLASEYIGKGGDYERAISIYEQALAVDPDNPELQAALAAAQEDRYMSRERFDRVEQGMTEAQVASAIGRPNVRNVRDFDGGAVAWFYPKSPRRDAAAVWFRPDRGRLEVYKVNFDEVPPSAPETGG